MLRDGDGWLVTNSFQFTKVHPAFSEPLWNAFRETWGMEFNNRSPQLRSEYSNPRSSWGQLFSYFVFTVSLKALSGRCWKVLWHPLSERLSLREILRFWAFIQNLAGICLRFSPAPCSIRSSSTMPSYLSPQKPHVQAHSSWREPS